MVSLPKFDELKSYLLKGSTLQDVCDAINTNRPCGTEGGGILLSFVSDTGSLIVLDQDDDGTLYGGGQGPALDVPDFDLGKYYFVTEAFWKKLEDAAARNHAVVADGGDLTAEESTEGIAIGTA